MSKGSSAGAGVAAGLGLVVVVIICGAFLGYRGREDSDPFPEPSRDTSIQFDFPDCDADDRSPNWEVADCGPSPTPKVAKTQGVRKTPGPIRTTRRR